jgi:formyltetrahydrofolate deformylase
MKTAILLMSCPDQKGLVYFITEFVYKYNGNIINLDQHIDKKNKIFFMRIEWELENFDLTGEEIPVFFEKLAKKFEMNWKLFFNDTMLKAAIFVSKQDHCLVDLLYRIKCGELKVNIPLIISNSENLRPIAEQNSIPFHVFEINSENKDSQEKKEIELLKNNKIDFVILARYMQIISEDFVNQYENKIINIHHSFLPAFIGMSPYLQAFNRGVKLIGATCHYVTKNLDEGPIISQDVAKISHRDTAEELMKKGKDIERLVLAEGVKLHTNHKTLVSQNKTVIFN